MSKLALFMVPELESKVNRHAYIGLCVDEIIREGYEPLMPVFYDQQPINQGKFFNSMLPMVDTIFMFINFGVDQAMLDMIDRTLRTKDIIYRRINDDLQAVYSNPRQILLEVSMKTGIGIDRIASKSRKREVVDARFVYCRRAKERTKASLAKIGEEIQRDHASVLHGITEAHETIQVKELYEKCYGDAKANTETMGAEENGENNAAKICRPILPYRSMDKREQEVQGGKSFVHSLSGAGYREPYSGYRPHNS